MGWSWTSPIHNPKEPIKAGDLVLDTTDNKIRLCVIPSAPTSIYAYADYIYKEGYNAGCWVETSKLEKMPAKTMLKIVQE